MKLLAFLLSLKLHHIVRNGCISEKAFLGNMQYRCVKHVTQQWREHASFPETLPDVQLIRALSIIQLHACLHIVVELADNIEHSRWHAKPSKDITQKCSVDGVLCFGEVDKAQMQDSILLPRQSLQSSYYEHRVNPKYRALSVARQTEQGHYTEVFG